MGHLLHILFSLCKVSYVAVSKGFIVLRIYFFPYIYDRELYGNKLTGKIPSALGNLMNLQSLDLYMNNINGSIPDTLGELKQLQFLYDHFP